MECPGCGAYSSSVLGGVNRGEGCPFCGLSVAAIVEIDGIRRSKADEALQERLAEVLAKLDQQQSEVAKARMFVRNLRDALDRFDGPDEP